MTLKRPFRWIGAGAGALALATSVAVGLPGVPVPSAAALHYEQVTEGSGASCSWEGQQYSHGARIEVKGSDGWIRAYRCDNGNWKLVSARAA